MLVGAEYNYSQRKVKSAFFSFLREHMVFFLGEINGKFVQISRFNMRNFAAKRREISRRNSVLVGEKVKPYLPFLGVSRRNILHSIENRFYF